MIESPVERYELRDCLFEYEDVKQTSALVFVHQSLRVIASALLCSNDVWPLIGQSQAAVSSTIAGSAEVAGLVRMRAASTFQMSGRMPLELRSTGRNPLHLISLSLVATPPRLSSARSFPADSLHLLHQAPERNVRAPREPGWCLGSSADCAKGATAMDRKAQVHPLGPTVRKVGCTLIVWTASSLD